MKQAFRDLVDYWPIHLMELAAIAGFIGVLLIWAAVYIKGA